MDIAQVALESIVIRFASSFEEIISCIISQIALPLENKLLSYFKKYGSSEIRGQINKSHNLGILIRCAQSELSFKDNARKMERLFGYLFGFSPFPSADNKDYILDMVLVRNIIIHEGGWPNENHARQIRHPHAIEVSTELDVGGSKKIFYELKLTDIKFIGLTIVAITEVMTHLASRLLNWQVPQ